ncbi:hypothetical protein EVAR_33507_1 [Eumeta japonica]|uniref:Uncharacterized protein n=1 Tax=Eumeta variegata TaxID=151549 RepID=A0A4C1VJJ3_EUMVA|nr:hypothetical protein EVAR_33507_1 [Eumeta japonica]
MKYVIPDVLWCAGSSSAKVVLQNLVLVVCLGWRGRRLAPLLEPSRQLVDGLLKARSDVTEMVPRRYTALSLVKSASWTPICGRGISFVYAEYSSGED